MPTLSVQQIPSAYQQALKLHEAGKLKEAHAIYNEIVALRPKTAEAHYQIGRIARKVGDRKVAVEALRRASELKPREPVVLRELAFALREADNSEGIIPVLHELLKFNPNDVQVHGELAVALQRLGRFKEARKHLELCMDQQPFNGVLFRVFVSGEKITDPNDPLFERMLKGYRNKAVTGFQRANFDFALAKAYEDSKQYDKVMKHLKRGNAEMHRAKPFRREIRDKELEAIFEAYGDADYTTPGPDPDPDFAPIFITGLPRSGTTLAEQIVSAHSSVTPTGESGELMNAMIRLGFVRDLNFRKLTEMTDADLVALRGAYKTLLKKRFDIGPIITDKSIQTWHTFGLIRKAMPNAKMIVLKRDLRDNMLSIYKNLFELERHTYAYRFDDIAYQIKSYHKVLDFWRERVPDCFVEISYDDLVADPETHGRKLVAAAGLEWEDGCLEFYKQKREIRTLSIHQARQPVYKSSTRSWERYGDEIQPMLDALAAEGLLPDGN